MFLSAAALIAGLALPAAAPRDELALRAKRLGFPQAHQIARDALPGARLVAGGEATVGAPRLGGDPDLPPAMKWPRCRGNRLTFLAQLPLADVAAVAPGAVPASGTLSVFAGITPDDSGVTRMEQEYGHVGKDTCVVVRTLRGTLARRKTPRKIATLRSRPVRLEPTLTVPDAYVAEARYKLTRKQADDYWRLESEAAAGTLGRKPDYGPVHQVLGWPQPVQDTPLYGCESSDEGLSHRLLLQLGFDDDLRFAIGDGGVLFLSGKPADLRAGRFNRLCSQFDQG